MQITFKLNLATMRENFFVGQVYDLPDERALGYLREGVATPAAAPAPLETAQLVAPAVETATAKQPRKKSK